jgi:hypothetical protein
VRSRGTEKEREKIRKIRAHPVICDGPETGYFGLFSKISAETERNFLIILEFVWTLEELYETIEYSLQKKAKKDTNMRRSIPPRDRSAVTLR